MRLSWQITFLVTVLMLLVLLSTLYISVHGSRQYLVGQLQTQARDTGSSLAMSLAPIIAAGDVALASALVDASFERGYYQQIHVRDTAGQTLIERALPVSVQGVPDWFVALTAVRSPLIQFPLMHGVKKVAMIEVVAHPANAYRALWQISQANIRWVSLLALAGVISIWLIVRYALRPLASVEQQALDISRQNYAIQKKLPFARELRQLVIAMNDMAEKLEGLMAAQIDQVIALANRVNTDTATGLLSRQGFDERLQRALQQEPQLAGQLLLIRICGLERVNQFFSHKRGNEELKKVLTRMKALAANAWEIGRLSGADMVVFIPDARGRDLAQRCAQLAEELNAASADLRCRIGAISIGAGQDKEHLLKQANQALQQAMTVDAGWYVGD
ncbi:MAG: LapD/MoxY N-terminal periplasmic domain-containing protein [Gammaproteobacteria bacterium]